MYWPDPVNVGVNYIKNQISSIFEKSSRISLKSLPVSSGTLDFSGVDGSDHEDLLVANVCQVCRLILVCQIICPLSGPPIRPLNSF